MILSPFTSHHLDPVAHALELIDANDGDIKEARDCARICALNVSPENDAEFIYWCRVLRALPPDLFVLEASLTMKRDWN